MPKSPEAVPQEAPKKFEEEEKEKRSRTLEAFFGVVKAEPYIFEALMDRNGSAYLVRKIAENLKTEDGLVHVTSERSKYFAEGIEVRDFGFFKGEPTGRKVDMQQGNMRIWMEKLKCGKDGHFDKGNNPNLLANAYAAVRDIEMELQELKKSMELVEEKDHSPKKGENSQVEDSKEYTFKHRD